MDGARARVCLPHEARWCWIVPDVRSGARHPVFPATLAPSARVLQSWVRIRSALGNRLVLVENRPTVPALPNRTLFDLVETHKRAFLVGRYRVAHPHSL